MKKIFFIVTTVFIFTGCKNNKNGEATSSDKSTSVEMVSPDKSSSPDGRFEFKSGILITETEMMGMGKSIIKMTFDNYGKQSLTEMTMKMMGKEMHSKSMMKDGYAYTWTEPASMAVKVKIEADKIDDKNIDYKHLSEEMRKKLNMKEEADETIDGKTCKVYSYSMKEGMAGKSYIWKGLPLQSEMNISGKKVTTKFVSFEENASIPSSTFDLPTGVEFKEIKKTEPIVSK